MRIPNWIMVILIILFVVTIPAIGWEEALTRCTVGLLTMILGIFVFIRGFFGGGDIKMTSALLLFVPSESYVDFLLFFAISLLTGVIVIAISKRIPIIQRSQFKGLTGESGFPMGISIAGAGIILVISYTYSLMDLI